MPLGQTPPSAPPQGIPLGAAPTQEAPRKRATIEIAVIAGLVLLVVLGVAWVVSFLEL